MIDYWLGIDSTITAKEAMRRLCEMEPDKYSGKAQIRTLQRRIKDWRVARTNELIFGQLGSQASKVQVKSKKDTSEATTVVG